ncbi:MAG: hypothetical protein PVI06_19800, partial [Desulfobacterales bacterium]
MSPYFSLNSISNWMVNRISRKGVLAIAFLCLAAYVVAFAGSAHADSVTINPVPVNGTVVDESMGIDINCGTGGSLCSDTFGERTVTLRANPDACYQFDSWTGFWGSPTANPKTYDSEDDPTAVGTAYFSKIIYTLTVTVAPAGSGTVTPSATTYVFDDGQVVRAEPAPGWQFVNWSGDTANLVDPNAAVTSLINPMCGDTAITANFAKIDYNLTTSVAPAGGGTVTPSTTYNFDSALALTATPNGGWGFVNWTGDTANLMDSNAASTNLKKPLYSDTSVTANFGQLFDLDINNMNWSSANDIIIEYGGTSQICSNWVCGPYSIPEGMSVTLTAVPGPSYKFDQWAGPVTGPTNPISFVKGAGPETVTPSFVSAMPMTWSLTVDVMNGKFRNSVKIEFADTTVVCDDSCILNIEDGQNVRLTAIADGSPPDY